MKDTRIILFDGVCNLCNASVNFIINHDRSNKFKFASLQSEAGKKLLIEHRFDPGDIQSVVLIEYNKVYIKSNAVLKIVIEFEGFWKLVYVLYIIPPFIRDLVYNLIAKNRYKMFGKKESCMLPTPELKEKFLV